MKNVLLSIILLFLSISSLYASGNIYTETILGKKCEVEDFSNLGNFRLPLSSNKYLLNSNIFIIEKENNKGQKLVYIDGKYYLKHFFGHNTLTFLDNGKKYYGILTKENGKKVFNLNGKESSEFESIEKIRGIGKYSFEKQIFEGINSLGERIYIRNGIEFKKKYEIIEYFYINGKIYYVGFKNNKSFLIDEKGNKTIEYDYINELTLSDDKKSYSFIGYKNNLSHSIVKDGIEIKKYTKENSNYLYGSNFYTVFGLRYFDKNISYFVKKNDGNKYIDYYLYKKSKIIKKRSYINVEIEHSKKFFINNSKNRDSFRNLEYIENSIIIGKSKEGIISFIYPNGEEFILEKGYDFDMIYKNTDSNFIFVIKNKKKEKFLIQNSKKYGPYIDIGLADHSLKSSKTVFHGIKENGKEVVIFDGNESKEYDKIYLSSVFDDSTGEFNNDGKKYSYVVSNIGSAGISVSLLIKDGVEGKLYPNISYKPGIDELTYSLDGKVFAYILVRDNGVIVEQNLKQSNLYKEVKIVTYDEKTKSFGLFAQKQNGKWTYVDNFKEVGEYKSYYNTYLSKDRTKFYFTDEKNNLIENGKVIGNNIINYYGLDKGHFLYNKGIIDSNNKDVYNSFELYLDGKLFKKFKKIDLIGLDEKGEFFSFLGDKKIYKCKIKDEKIINKILVNTKNIYKNIYLYIFTFIILFLIIFIFIKFKGK